MEEKILTLHPDPSKKGVRIDKAKYEQVREVILEIMNQHQPLTFSELANSSEQALSDRFDGSISWYVVTVKLDLESKGFVERIPKTRPEMLRLTSQSLLV